MTAIRVLRLVGRASWLHLVMMSRSISGSLLLIVWPLVFATTALLMYRIRSSPEDLVFAGLGASVMTIWTAISSTASGILQRERFTGTLELLVAAPTPFPLVILSMSVAASTVGAYGMVVTALWARLVFDVHIAITRPLAFAAAVTVTIVSVCTLGFVLSVTVVRYRAAWALGHLLEYPVWLICGFLVPISLLPSWVRPVSWMLAPSWGMQAIRDAASGATSWDDTAKCLGLATVYGVVGVRLARSLLISARRHATLALT